ncbi:hypothetical protein CRE_21612 [Caenorhabditis remanei]|uniref:DNA2/NAM7 helicase-like C-terminal domain-containing protein n=1 Tax=Caenorhabditis remanei TaxID=31234 RepID=E3NMX2_CAERE|nr:hypothetical protein CRE_21612 [Caenorhabditis remanei]
MNEFVAKNEAFDPSNLTTIGTIDSVQGQEYDCVIFSMVRSNPKTTIGFIAEVRRLNVVVTRAKRHFIFIGNGYMLHSSHKPEIRKFFEIIQYKEQRFHPNLVCGIPAPGLVAREVKNNFGQNFQPFIENSNDPRMIEWCREFIENSRKPDFVQRRRERVEQRQEEARIRAQMDFEARELKRKCNVSNGQDPPAPIP